MYDNRPQEFSEFGPARAPEQNPLAIVGFVLSFCLSPIGLLLSLIALSKPPRGFAIAGVVVGLLGTGVWACVIGGFAMFSGSGLMKMPQVVAAYQQVHTAVEQHQAANNNQVPADQAALSAIVPIPVDPWGKAFVYEAGASGEDFTFKSAGVDGTFGTADDIVIHSSEEPQLVMQRLMEEAMQRAGYMPPTQRPATPQGAGSSPPATPAGTAPATDSDAPSEPADSDSE